MVDIALDLGVTARTLTTMVDALERQDLITRVPDPDDRRAIQLELSESGRALMEPLAQAVESASEVIMSPLDAAERATLLRLLTRLIERDGGE
jgi:DNA-binding MarR family transcriptional regulator